MIPLTNRASRIGIYGGTFDPPHAGHLAVARTAIQDLKLDRLLLVVSADPPHKPGGVRTPALQRFAMVQALADLCPGAEASDIEMRRPGHSYTVDTLREIRKQYPEADIFLILGTDQLNAFNSWHLPDEILTLAILAVCPRPGVEQLETEWPPHVKINSSALELSATKVRDRIAAGDEVTSWVPEPVLSIIHRNRLYRTR